MSMKCKNEEKYRTLKKKRGIYRRLSKKWTFTRNLLKCELIVTTYKNSKDIMNASKNMNLQIF